MKIRVRGFKHGSVHEVIEESPSFYIVKAVDGLTHAVCRKDCYERVEDWVDVTHCVTIEDRCVGSAKSGTASESGVYHCGTRLAILTCGGKYRVSYSPDRKGLVIDKKECC